MGRALILLSVLVFGFTSSCDKLYEIPETVYLIQAGKHKSNVVGSLPGNGVRSLKSELLQFTARFDQSAIYNLGDNDQDDINKLFGFSDCNSLHHENSARFGWKYNIASNKVDIYAYVYAHGNREIKYLGSTDINVSKTYRLRLIGQYYEFEFDQSVEKLNRGSSCDMGLYYLLYPYFGGNQKAPHDIKIYIKESL